MNEIELIGKSEKSELLVSSESSWSLFDKISEILESELKGLWVEKLDSLDQRYWDLKVGNEILTLHLEHYLGIVAYSKSQELVQCAKLVIERKGSKL